jgi:D-glycero-alpha-D-manno-heptose 1-phosphate guanylyltransferase
MALAHTQLTFFIIHSSFFIQMECILLAGGLGTRLRSVVAELPKCMAPVAGKPFLAHITAYLQRQGVEKLIFAIGYKSQAIIDFIETEQSAFSVQFSTETEPLGTGGAIQLACKKATEKNVLVVNGDTLFDINLKALLQFHEANDADCTLSLKPMQDFERYGVVETDEAGRVQSFKEKQYYAEGLINGGVYALNAERLLAEALPEKFSFEKDYLEALYKKRRICALVQDAYFIDIGIPEDYARAQRELKEHS